MVPGRMDALPRQRPKCRGRKTIGKPYTCHPHLAPDNMKETLEWSWFPWDFKVGVITFLQIVSAVLVVFSYASLLFFRGPFTRVLAAFITVMLPVVAYLTYIIDWNFRLREAMCFTAGKKIQAEETWFTHLEENGEKDRAKELYHAETFRNVVFNVLKDGTLEFRNRGSEFSEAFGAQFMGVKFDDRAMRHAQPESPASAYPTPTMAASENV